MAHELIVQRHEKKEKRANGVVAGSPEDKQLGLSPEGMMDAFLSGRSMLRCYTSDNPYPIIVSVASDHLRAVRTNEQMLVGAGYNPNDERRVITAEVPMIGLGVKVRDGVTYDWETGFPIYDPHAPDPHTLVLLQDCYRPNPNNERQVVMARYIVSQLAELLIGQRELAESEQDNGLFLMTTHGGIIDGLANALYGSLVIDDQGLPHLEDFPGSFLMGERIQGHIEHGKTDPLYVMQVKGKEVQYKRSNLEAMMRQHRAWMDQPLRR